MKNPRCEDSVVAVHIHKQASEEQQFVRESSSSDESIWYSDYAVSTAQEAGGIERTNGEIGGRTRRGSS